MPWDRSAPANPKYQTREHRALSAAYKQQIRAGNVLECRAPECLFSTRAITNPNGNQADGVTVGHQDDGIAYRGPEHRRCNLHDAAKRARARQEVTALRW